VGVYTYFGDTFAVLSSEEDGPGDSAGVLALEEEGFCFAVLEAEDFVVAADVEFALFVNELVDKSKSSRRLYGLGFYDVYEMVLGYLFSRPEPY